MPYKIKLLINIMSVCVYVLMNIIAIELPAIMTRDDVLSSALLMISNQNASYTGKSLTAKIIIYNFEQTPQLTVLK